MQVQNCCMFFLQGRIHYWQDHRSHKLHFLLCLKGLNNTKLQLPSACEAKGTRFSMRIKAVQSTINKLFMDQNKWSLNALRKKASSPLKRGYAIGEAQSQITKCGAPSDTVVGHQLHTGAAGQARALGQGGTSAVHRYVYTGPGLAEVCGTQPQSYPHSVTGLHPHTASSVYIICEPY